MEVHHHSNAHGKKTWKSYFWEFLMLFLAVFCGFLAENQREHYVEYQREKQFIRSMIEDLKLDTAGFASNIESKKRRQLRIDSALYPLTKMQGNELPLRICLNLIRTSNNPYFFSNNGTIQQLKGSGGMRLIRNRKAVDSIEAYDFQIRRIMLRQEQASFVVGGEYDRIINNFISGKVIFEECYDSLYQQKQFNPETMIKINSVYLNELINQLMSIRGNNVFQIGLYSDIKNKAENIIGFLKKEYHLK